MNDSSIILVKLYNGDMIIGKKSVPADLDTKNPQIWGRVCLKDPRQIMVIPTMTGDIKIGIVKVSHPFNVKRLEQELYINSTQIMYTLDEDEIQNELINGYKSEVSGIRIASANESAIINNKNPGDFVL